MLSFTDSNEHGTIGESLFRNTAVSPSGEHLYHPPEESWAVENHFVPGSKTISAAPQLKAPLGFQKSPDVRETIFGHHDRSGSCLASDAIPVLLPHRIYIRYQPRSCHCTTNV